MESPQTGIAKLQQTHDISKHSVPRGFSTKSQAQNPLEKSIFAIWHNQNWKRKAENEELKSTSFKLFDFTH